MNVRIRTGTLSKLEEVRWKFPIYFFADDVLLFGEANLYTLESLINTLDNFCKNSGQKVNKSKSHIFFSKNTSLNIIDEFEQALNVSKTDDLGDYLGFPLSTKKPSRTKLSSIINKVSKKLTTWKANSLSKAGRATLILPLFKQSQDM